ncbi:MAG: hypothetical protein AB1449_12750 [Chloroflexota bacterium]
MYSLVLILHSLVRWVVILAAAWAIARALRGWIADRPWLPLDHRVGLVFTMAMDVQVLLGLVLVFVSPLAQEVLGDPSGAMASPELRFFAVEHVPLMVLAAVAAYAGSVLSRKATDDRARHRRAALAFVLSLAMVLIAVPWSRPLLRLG